MFAVGETVELKSGGPTMTVESSPEAMGTGGIQKVWCQWFSKGAVERAPFPLASLRKVKPVEYGFSQATFLPD